MHQLYPSESFMPALSTLVCSDPVCSQSEVPFGGRFIQFAAATFGGRSVCGLGCLTIE